MITRMLPRTSIPISNKEISAALKGFLLGKSGDEKEVAKFENELMTYLGIQQVFCAKLRVSASRHLGPRIASAIALKDHQNV